MNLLFHEQIALEQYKDRLVEAAHWRLAKQLKQEQNEGEQPRLRSTSPRILESSRGWLAEALLFRQSSKKKTS